MVIEKTTPDKITFSPDSSSTRPGAWFLGRFLYWDKTLKKSVIALSRSQEKIEHLLEFLTWIIIFAGWLAFGFWLFNNQATLIVHPLRLLIFWNKSNPLILFFVLTLWFDLFLIYKKSEAKAGKKKIDYHNFLIAKKKKLGSSTKYNVAKAYSLETAKMIEDAYLLANKLRQKEVTIIHLFRILLKVKEIQTLFIRLNVDAKKLVELVDHRLVKPQDDDFKGRTELASALEEVLILAFVEAYDLNQESIDVLNLISFCCSREPLLAEVLNELEIDQDKIINTVEWFRVNRRLLANYKTYHQLALLKPGTGMNRAYTAIATPTLDHFSHDITIQSKYGAAEICVGREKEINSIFEAFTGGHAGVLLVGPLGVGKSAIISGLAQLMVEENVPQFLKDKRLVELDVSRLVSGADASQAEDLAQETLVEAWKSLRRFNGQCQFFTWLCAILLNRHRNGLRVYRPITLTALAGTDRDELQSSLENVPDPAALPSESLQQREHSELVRRCIGALPEKQQQVIFLRFYVDDSIDGIAAALGCSPGTVKSRLFNALERLRGMNALNRAMPFSESEVKTP